MPEEVETMTGYDSRVGFDARVLANTIERDVKINLRKALMERARDNLDAIVAAPLSMQNHIDNATFSTQAGSFLDVAFFLDEGCWPDEAEPHELGVDFTERGSVEAVYKYLIRPK